MGSKFNLTPGEGLTRDKARKTLTSKEADIFDLLVSYGVIIDNFKRIQIAKRIAQMLPETEVKSTNINDMQVYYREEELNAAEPPDSICS